MILKETEVDRMVLVLWWLQFILGGYQVANTILHTLFCAPIVVLSISNINGTSRGVSAAILLVHVSLTGGSLRMRS